MFRFSVRKNWKVRQVSRVRTVASLVFCLVVRAQADSTARATQQHKGSSKTAQTAPAAQTFTLVGAGDIAACQHLASAQATARLIAQIPGTVFAAGDLAYEQGSPDQFRNCYDKTWGEFKDRTKPALGNHEYGDRAAAGYFAYWGAEAGPADKGYYSYDLGDWHIVVLNTNCNAKALGGCDTGSPEETWLRSDLAKYPNACILAYGHHPLFSSGLFKKHALHPSLRSFWEDLYAVHADLILAGHEHSYERFAPQDPQGNPDPARGIREIVVGTGGRSHSPLGVRATRIATGVPIGGELEYADQLTLARAIDARREI